MHCWRCLLVQWLSGAQECGSTMQLGGVKQLASMADSGTLRPGAPCTLPPLPSLLPLLLNVCPRPCSPTLPASSVKGGSSMQGGAGGLPLLPPAAGWHPRVGRVLRRARQAATRNPATPQRQPGRGVPAWRQRGILGRPGWQGAAAPEGQQQLRRAAAHQVGAIPGGWWWWWWWAWGPGSTMRGAAAAGSPSGWCAGAR